MIKYSIKIIPCLIPKTVKKSGSNCMAALEPFRGSEQVGTLYLPCYA